MATSRTFGGGDRVQFMDHAVVHTDAVPRVDMSETFDGLFDPDVRRVQAALGTEQLVTNLWYFEADETMVHHSHEQQEELFYVLEGEFAVKFGAVGATQTERVGVGGFFAAGPGVKHGHACVSDTGVLLAVGAPNEPDIQPASYTDFEDA